jgi:hypothetical protein
MQSFITLVTGKLTKFYHEMNKLNGVRVRLKVER